jgi:hypothetical protein
MSGTFLALEHKWNTPSVAKIVQLPKPILIGEYRVYIKIKQNNTATKLYQTKNDSHNDNNAKNQDETGSSRKGWRKDIKQLI